MMRNLSVLVVPPVVVLLVWILTHFKFTEVTFSLPWGYVQINLHSGMLELDTGMWFQWDTAFLESNGLIDGRIRPYDVGTEEVNRWNGGFEIISYREPTVVNSLLGGVPLLQGHLHPNYRLLFHIPIGLLFLLLIGPLVFFVLRRKQAELPGTGFTPGSK